jgi:hypothetical protein
MGKQRNSSFRVEIGIWNGKAAKLDRVLRLEFGMAKQFNLTEP